LWLRIHSSPISKPFFRSGFETPRFYLFRPIPVSGPSWTGGIARDPARENFWKPSTFAPSNLEKPAQLAPASHVSFPLSFPEMIRYRHSLALSLATESDGLSFVNLVRSQLCPRSRPILHCAQSCAQPAEKWRQKPHLRTDEVAGGNGHVVVRFRVDSRFTTFTTRRLIRTKQLRQHDECRGPG
jgi:hypothetical protein